MVYFVGENNGSNHNNPVLAATGVGLDVAQSWEKAIRQALMPVTPQASICTAAGQGRVHSKEAERHSPLPLMLEARVQKNTVLYLSSFVEVISS